MKPDRQWLERLSYASVLLGASASSAFATSVGGTLPWDGPINTITQDLVGPVAHGITMAAIILGGLAWAHTEHGSGARKLSAVGIGGAAALGAVQVYSTVFPFASALL